MLVMSIHGIRTKGEWQDQLDKVLQTEQYPHEKYNYGYYGLFRFLCPFSNKKMVDDFYLKFCEIMNRYKVKSADISICAHSFGTFILGYCMLKYPDVKINKLILCGSILPNNFDWHTLFVRNQVNSVRNEYGKLDFWTKVVKYFVRGTGTSGNEGFMYSRPQFYEEKFDFFSHSDYFDGNHIRNYWFPFIKKALPVFETCNGKDIGTLTEYTTILKASREIDKICYNNLPNYDQVALPQGLSTTWISVNPDIYTFVFSGSESSRRLKGYINAMPVDDNSFLKICKGELQDNEITAKNILPYGKNQTLKIYLMSIATMPDARSCPGLITPLLDRLLSSFFDKLINYWKNDKIKISEFIATTWTAQGEHLCRLLGMTKISSDKFGNSNFLLSLEKPNQISNRISQGFDKLIQAYNT